MSTINFVCIRVFMKSTMEPVYIRTKRSMGRGCYANRDISAGHVITECEIIVLSHHDTLIIRQTVLKRYYYNFSADSGCIVLGVGSLFNHTERSNVGFVLVQKQNRNMMQFYAKIDIRTNEELLINYDDDGADAHEDVKVYTKDIIPSRI